MDTGAFTTDCAANTLCNKITLTYRKTQGSGVPQQKLVKKKKKTGQMAVFFSADATVEFWNGTARTQMQR